MESNIEYVTLAELKEELPNGLKVYAQTSWGWAELKAAPFVRQVEKSNAQAVVYGFVEARRCGGITLKVPYKI